MAVQKKRKTRSRRDMRRSHDALSQPALSTDELSGERHQRHHLGRDGFYRGRRVLVIKEKDAAKRGDDDAADTGG